MIFSAPVPFQEALDSRAVRTILPTTLDHAQYRALGQDILNRATISAGVANAGFLDTVEGTVRDAIAGRLDRATARVQLQTAADGISEASFLDDARLDLILETNIEMAQGYGQWVQGQAAVEAFPCAELFRLEDRKDQRDWEARWNEAARASGDGQAALALDQGGRMAARKDSAIWDSLGSLWDDSLGNPYPPFAFRSGMWVQDVDRDDALALGLIEEDTQIEPQHREFNAGFQMTVPVQDAELRSTLLRGFGDAVEFDNGVLKVKSRGEPANETDHLPVRAADRQTDASGADARTGSAAGEKLAGELRSAYLRVAPSESAAARGASIDAAELAAVERGVKPLYHEHWGDELAPQLAAPLRLN